MQIMIDTAAESPADLRRIAAMLVFAASQVEGSPAVPAGTVVAAPALPAPVVVLSPPVEVMKADAGHASEPTAAEAFAKVPAAPVVPLVPSVPAAPSPIVGGAATQAVANAAAELDGAGLPWDARIHSTPAKQNANGLWRMRRGVTPDVIQNVEAELRTSYPAKVAAPPVQVTAPLVPLPPNVPVPPAAGANAPPAPVTLPGVPTPGGAVSAPVAPGVPSGNDAFRVMMDRFSKEMGANGRLNKTVMAPIFAAIGVNVWTDFFKKPELIPGITAECERLMA